MLGAVQDVLMRALLEDDPVEALSLLLLDAKGLTAEERSWLERLDSDGLRMTGLLVRKLRFERLTRADPRLAALFLERPEEFMKLFASYTGEVAPTAYLPAAEGELFRRWQERPAEGTIGENP